MFPGRIESSDSMFSAERMLSHSAFPSGVMK